MVQGLLKLAILLPRLVYVNESLQPAILDKCELFCIGYLFYAYLQQFQDIFSIRLHYPPPPRKMGGNLLPYCGCIRLYYNVLRHVIQS